MRPAILMAMATAAGLWAAQAQAAPQMLGLMATSAPQPMRCTETVCTVELSAFCLQRDRDEPAAGTSYDAHDPTHIVLEVTSADGTTAEVPVGAVAEIASARGAFAVTVSLPRETVDALGTEPAIAVAPLATLVPTAEPGDPDPLSDVEIARAAGPVRGLAGLISESATSVGNTARILARLINTLPEDASSIPDRRSALWEQALDAVGGRHDAAGAEPAARKFANCGYAPSAGMSIKNCLRDQHDAAVGSMNIDIWTVTGAGS